MSSSFGRYPENQKVTLLRNGHRRKVVGNDDLRLKKVPQTLVRVSTFFFWVGIPTEVCLVSKKKIHVGSFRLGKVGSENRPSKKRHKRITRPHSTTVKTSSLDEL